MKERPRHPGLSFICAWPDTVELPYLLSLPYRAKRITSSRAPQVYDLRHSAATISLTMKIHPKVVQEILGHSQITTTMDIYSHAMPDMQGDATQKWDEFGKPAKKRGKNNHLCKSQS